MLLDKSKETAARFTESLSDTRQHPYGHTLVRGAQPVQPQGWDGDADWRRLISSWQASMGNLIDDIRVAGFVELNIVGGDLALANELEAETKISDFPGWPDSSFKGFELELQPTEPVHVYVSIGVSTEPRKPFRIGIFRGEGFVTKALLSNRSASHSEVMTILGVFVAGLRTCTSK